MRKVSFIPKTPPALLRRSASLVQSRVLVDVVTTYALPVIYRIGYVLAVLLLAGIITGLLLLTLFMLTINPPVYGY